MIQKEFIVILYYKYVAIENPEELHRSERALCERLGLKGRIIISAEGINGTLEGERGAIEEYCVALHADPRFSDVHIKRSAGTPDGTAFPRLSIRVRKEIVGSHLMDYAGEDIKPTELTGKRLSPDELKRWYDEGRDFTIVDMRNDYEQSVGHFRGSVFSGMNNFRDLPRIAESGPLQKLKDAIVLTVCTGGVRCEKASGYLVKKGFKEVYQLDGGIVSYMEKYPSRDFLGSLYVFDCRETMHFDAPDAHVVVGRCATCAEPSEHFTNCKNDACHLRLICCEECIEKNGGVSCVECVHDDILLNNKKALAQ